MSSDQENKNKTISKVMWLTSLLCIVAGCVSLLMPQLFLGLPGVGPLELKIGGVLLIVVGISDAVLAKIITSKK